jgi:hypothetical protein
VKGIKKILVVESSMFRKTSSKGKTKQSWTWIVEGEQAAEL